MKNIPLAIFFLMLTACNEITNKPNIEGGRIETGPPALHAIRDNQLRELMGRMDSLMQERYMTETELDSERHRYALQIANTADSLLKTINAIIEHMPKLALTPEEQKSFLALAKKLSEQAQRLQEQAKNNQIDTIGNSLSIINSTCTSCHALYRKTRG